MKENKISQISEIINLTLNVNIFENSRKREVVDARSLFCYILRKDLKLTLITIRDIFRANGKHYDHASVLHSVKIYDVVLINNKYYEELRDIILSEYSYKHLLLKKIEQIEDEGILKDINNCINHYE
jgi:chromosomal replication initiation ATPase DnaA